MSEIFPLDIWSIKEYGVKKWYKDFNRWPVSEEERSSIFNDIEQLYSNIILNSEPEISDIFAVLYKLTSEYQLLLNSILTVDRLEKTEIKTTQYFQYTDYFPTLLWFCLLLLLFELACSQLLFLTIP